MNAVSACAPREARLLVVGIGGTSRPGSTCEAALLYSLRCAREIGAETVAFTGDDLRLPFYEPHVEARDEKARRLVAALRRADGVIVSAPGYHGLLSGLVKNALDYTEDMSRDERAYLDGCAVGNIVAANGAQALGSTLASLRAMTHALRGWPTPYAATLVSGAFGWSDGAPQDVDARAALSLVARQVVEFAQMKVLSGQGRNRVSEALAS